MNSRIILSVAAKVTCLVSCTAVLAETRPLTIINATGKEICVSWGHSDKDLKTALYCLDVGGDIRDITEWNIDKDTYLFVGVKNLSNPEYNPGIEGKYQFSGYKYLIKPHKTVNVKIVLRKIGSRNTILVEPNSRIWGLKEADIMVVPEKGDPRSVAQIKNDGFPSKSSTKISVKELIED